MDPRQRLGTYQKRLKRIKRLQRAQEAHNALPKEREIPHAEWPGYDGVPLDYDYTGLDIPHSFVLSGPLGEAKGRGRRFKTPAEAYYWAVDTYGEENVIRLEKEGSPRWAVRIKKSRI